MKKTLHADEKMKTRLDTRAEAPEIAQFPAAGLPSRRSDWAMIVEN